LAESLTLTQALAFFDEAEELSLESRTVSEKSRDYYDHKQWTSQEKSTLNKRGQPAITRNRIKPKVDFLKGLETQTRTDPKAFPRTPGDDDAASAATDAIRFVCDQQKYINTKSACFENLTIEGTCGVEIYAKEGRNGDIDVCIKRYQWDRLGWDPHSREKDFSDSAYRYGVAWMDYDQAILRYPGKEEALESTIASEGLLSTTYDDAPRIRWADANRKRVRVVKMEYKVGEEVHVCEFTRGGFLSDPEPSPWLDEDGKPEWSIIMQSAHVDRDGNRYGWVQAWLDLQDEINKRASKYLHNVSVRQTYSNAAATGENANEFRKQLARPDGHLEFQSGEWGKDFGIVPTMDMAAAQFNILQEAKAELDSVGVNAALSGADQRGLSGKAIGRLQQGGSTEIKPLLDCMASFNQQVYRVVWNRIKQFWTAEKWVRVTDDENNLKWVGLNQPITLGQQLEQEQQAQDPSWQLPPEYANDPRLNEVVEVKNNVAEIDVDIIIDEVPDTITVQQEQFEALTALFPAVPDMQKPAMLEMLVQSSTLRNKSQLLDKLTGAGQQQDPAQMQAQQAQQAMQMEHQQALTDEIRSKTEKNRASAAKDEAATGTSQLANLTTISQAEGDYEREQQMNMEGQPMM
jgi:hypothetical protein